MSISSRVCFLVCLGLLSGCGSDSSSDPGSQILPGVLPGQPTQVARDGRDETLDADLTQLLALRDITADPTTGLELPSINSPLAQLGMKLFYSKSLSGEIDTACVSCHHPVLGGGDNLSLGIGVHAMQENQLGPGRRHSSGTATVPRNAPTTFNSGLYRDSLFWDSRVSRLDSGIRTPDSEFGVADSHAGLSLLEAQAKFPVTSVEEMKSEHFEHQTGNTMVRNHLAARIGGYDGGFNAQQELTENRWLIEFQTTFGTSESAESVVSYQNIAKALAAYQSSQVFIQSPWKRYVDGESAAISDDAKRGALLFYTAKEEGGADCFRCHEGDNFTDESHHVVAFPQIGPGKGNGEKGDDDFGLERESGNAQDRYKFRTPSLLNVAVTAPYGHSGAYKTLHDVVNHYNHPSNAVSFFTNKFWCTDFADTTLSSCADLYPNARTNTERAQQVLASQTATESIESVVLNSDEVKQIVAFLEALTDPCTQSRECLGPWIPEPTGGPDGNQLNAVNEFEDRL